jgi:hypothetical protein
MHSISVAHAAAADQSSAVTSSEAQQEAQRLEICWHRRLRKRGVIAQGSLGVFGSGRRDIVYAPEVDLKPFRNAGAASPLAFNE